ncbi:hypothetical protein T07_14996 [Trichinella nelsoni]|uniref:Uncharacterized protein n=1 Tax=Trichinella nelsoni TaxID=6336 RepID=A0A0V0RRK4_9BILA|nr:hypothetical protein T07_14996 [Trichinella nelsoni]
MCRVELTTPMSDRVTSQTVTGDDLSFQAVLKQMRPLNALHIVDDKFEYTKYVTSVVKAKAKAVVFSLSFRLTCTPLHAFCLWVCLEGPPYDLGLVVIADDTLWLGKGKVLVQFGSGDSGNMLCSGIRFITDADNQNENSKQHSDQWDEIGQVRRGMRDGNVASSEKQKENMSFELTDARQRLDEIN